MAAHHFRIGSRILLLVSALIGIQEVGWGADYPHVVPVDLNGNGRDVLLLQKEIPNQHHVLGVLVPDSYGKGAQALFPYSYSQHIPKRGPAEAYALERNSRCMPIDFNGDGKNEIFSYNQKSVALLAGGPGMLKTLWQAPETTKGERFVHAPTEPFRFSAVDEFYRVNLGNGRQGVFVVGRGGRTCLLAMPSSGVKLVWEGEWEVQDGSVQGWVTGPAGSWNVRSSDRVVPADLNGDGVDEILMFDQRNAGILAFSDGKYRLSKRVQDVVKNVHEDSKYRVLHNITGKRDTVVAYDTNNRRLTVFVADRSGALEAHALASVHGSSQTIRFDNLADGLGVVPIDRNGDGKDELFMHEPGGKHWLLSFDTPTNVSVAAYDHHTWITGREWRPNLKSSWKQNNKDSYYAAEIDGRRGEELIVYNTASNELGILKTQVRSGAPAGGLYRVICKKPGPYLDWGLSWDSANDGSHAGLTVERNDPVMWELRPTGLPYQYNIVNRYGAANHKFHGWSTDWHSLGGKKGRVLVRQNDPVVWELKPQASGNFKILSKWGGPGNAMYNAELSFDGVGGTHPLATVEHGDPCEWAVEPVGWLEVVWKKQLGEVGVWSLGAIADAAKTTPWPTLDNASYQHISNRITANGTGDIRSRYRDGGDPVVWLSVLGDLKKPGPIPAAQWNQTRNQLLVEFGYLRKIERMFKNVDSLNLAVRDILKADAQHVSTKIGDIDASGGAAETDLLGTAVEVLGIAGGEAGIAGTSVAVFAAEAMLSKAGGKTFVIAQSDPLSEYVLAVNSEFQEVAEETRRQQRQIREDWAKLATAATRYQGTTIVDFPKTSAAHRLDLYALVLTTFYTMDTKLESALDDSDRDPTRHTPMIWIYDKKPNDKRSRRQGLVRRPGYSSIAFPSPAARDDILLNGGNEAPLSRNAQLVMARRFWGGEGRWAWKEPHLYTD